ncbi:MAG: ABC transporter ATP-binding protein/permease [Candidatus Shapirobacteria bacterium]|nr:ABC transporter ATP-binding protein/permease [Candidatus Shapirobacteria bacterium]
MKDNTRKTLRFYWQTARSHKISLWLTVFSIAIANVVDSITPVYFKYFFNELSSGQAREVIVKSLLSILVVIAGLSFTRWLLWRVGGFATNFFESISMGDLSKRCFEYLHRHSYAYFSNNFTGSVVKKTKSFVSSFEVLADQLFYELLPSTVKVLIITLVLAKVNIFLGLGMLLWTLMFMVINWGFTKYKIKYDIQRSEAETTTSSFLADTVTNNTNIKLFNGYEKESWGYADLVDKLHKIRLFSWDLSAKFYALQSFLLVVLEIGIFYFAIRLWQREILTVGDFVLIQSYIIEVVMMVWDFGRVITRIYEHLAEAEEMTLILNTPHEIKDDLEACTLEVKSGEIKFDKVDFGYEDGDKVITNFNLTVNAGQTVALVGLSGSGKSTLMKLILRLHDIQKGKILIDGQDIAKVTQESLRSQISLVPQDPILFHRSLMENIRYGRFNASDKEVIEASKLAYCDEFISKLSKGYKTFVGERGIKLSGGERQRVAIARAILRNSPILILDEATSSLDSESEKYIQEALANLTKDKTVIVIAHRLSTIKKVDRIVVLDKGKIIEDGSHSQLIKKDKGIYKQLWDIQVGGFIK